MLMKRLKGGLSPKGTNGSPCAHPPCGRSRREEQRRNLPRRALCPSSSGKNLLSTAHTRRWSGRLGDLAPTRRKPAGTSMGSLEMETRRRSFPAWQNPRRDGQAHTLPSEWLPQSQDPRGQRGDNSLVSSATAVPLDPADFQINSENTLKYITLTCLALASYNHSQQ